MKFLSLFRPSFFNNVVYMLQSGGYDVRSYIVWFWTAPDIGRVMNRGSLNKTVKAKVLIASGWVLAVAQFEALAWYSVEAESFFRWLVLIGFFFLIPIVSAHLLALISMLGNLFVQKPKTRQIASKAHEVFAAHPGIVIAIAGSYGKTTMKTMLAAVLGEAKIVAVSSGNKNTPIGLSQFAETLSGNEDIVIAEMGESQVGDVRELCDLTQPDFGIITGIAAQHVRTFGNVENIVSTVFELAEYLGAQKVVANGESPLVAHNAPDGLAVYSNRGLSGWKPSKIKVTLDGTSFRAKKGKIMVNVECRLLGRHQVGPLLAVIDAASGLGLTPKQIEAGIKKIEPFEHRFQKTEVDGAVVIDDTYNGNIEGLRAGAAFAADIGEVKRKILITPGLVETGMEKENLHRQIGELAAPVYDMVVLMKNSNLEFIKQGLESAGFNGEVVEVDDPLKFYTNLGNFVSKGDLVLMQNDLSDNYS